MTPDDLAKDPALLAELRVARSWGVPPSRLRGWEPAEVTTYVRDGAGRLTSARTVREPAWSPADLEAALALAVYEAGLCPGCQHPLAETAAPENEMRYREADTVRCHRCTAIEQVAKRYEDSPAPAAILLDVRLRGSESSSPR